MHFPVRLLVMLSLAAGTLAAQHPMPAAPAHAVLLKPDRVFDATGDATHTGWVVLVQGVLPGCR